MISEYEYTCWVGEECRMRSCHQHQNFSSFILKSMLIILLWRIPSSGITRGGFVSRISSAKPTTRTLKRRGLVQLAKFCFTAYQKSFPPKNTLTRRRFRTYWIMSSPRLAIKPQEKPSTGDKLDGALCVVQITLVMVNRLGGSVIRLHAKKQPGMTPDLWGCSDLFEIPSLKLISIHAVGFVSKSQ